MRLISPPLQLRGLVEDLADQIEKRKASFLAAFSILYLAVTALLASQKLLWNDELYTLYISRLSTISDVWSALSTGAEQLPPFFYVITRASLALFGAHELSVRLPEVIGFWVMGVCLFQFVSKRTSAVYGFLAPTGRFEVTANDNVGSGYWTHAFSSGQTFFLTEDKRPGSGIRRPCPALLAIGG